MTYAHKLGGLKQKLSLSQLWRLAGRVAASGGSERGSVPRFSQHLVVAGKPRCSLACSRITPISFVVS